MTEKVTHRLFISLAESITAEMYSALIRDHLTELVLEYVILANR